MHVFVYVQKKRERERERERERKRASERAREGEREWQRVAAKNKQSDCRGTCYEGCNNERRDLSISGMLSWWSAADSEFERV